MHRQVQACPYSPMTENHWHLEMVRESRLAATPLDQWILRYRRETVFRVHRRNQYRQEEMAQPSLETHQCRPETAVRTNREIIRCRWETAVLANWWNRPRRRRMMRKNQWRLRAAILWKWKNCRYSGTLQNSVKCDRQILHI